MAGEKERADAYLDTIDRIEPDIAPIDAAAFYASASISLRRIGSACNVAVGMFVIYVAGNLISLILHVFK